MKIPFTKAHGAKNDFLLTWAGDAPASGLDELARGICDRHTGIGADGWMLMAPGSGGDHAGISSIRTRAGAGATQASGDGREQAAAVLSREHASGKIIRSNPARLANTGLACFKIAILRPRRTEPWL